MTLNVVVHRLVGSAHAEIPTAMGTVREARAATTTTIVLGTDLPHAGAPLMIIRPLGAGTMTPTVATTLLRTRI